MARGAKGKYKEWLTEDGLLTLKGWAREGLTDKQIAENIGISRGTFYDWINKYPQFSDTIKKGRVPFIVKAEDALEKNIEGYYVEETIEEITKQPDGREIKHKRITKRFIKPDPALIIFYNKCRNGKKFNDRPQVVESDSLGKLDEILQGVKNYAETETKSGAGAGE